MNEPEGYARPKRPSPERGPDPGEARKQLDAFVADVRSTVARLKSNKKLGANSVVVEPGGHTFPTIGAALASITDASQKKQYVVSIGPGTYSEVVTCKPWVFLAGSGRGQTIITAASQSDPTKKGTIRASSHSAIQDSTVQSTMVPAGAWVVAVDCQSAVDFDVENCELMATDPTKQAQVNGLALDDWGGAGSQVNVAYTTITANGGWRPIAINVYYAAYAHGTESKFVAQNGQNPGCGGFAADASTFLVEGSYVEGAGYCLFRDTNPKTSITANQCQLKGPVGPGVVVHP
jgi:Pectinesterase